MKKRLVSLLLFLLLAACGAESQPAATSAPAETHTPAQEPAATEPLPTREPLPDTVSYGQTDQGAFYRGNPDAAVTITDYSDFL